MLLYEVCVAVRDDLRSSFERYMREKHIPEIWATGCFTHIHFERAEAGHYRTCYQAPNREKYAHYLAHHANALRADFALHFPEGCQPSREVYEVVQQWGKHHSN